MPSYTVTVVGGPAGTGKSTVAQLLSAQLGCPFIEGDALHPPQNVDKMSRGIPLTDEDRWGWLKALSGAAYDRCAESENTTGGCIVLCSMLKRVYRSYIKKCGQQRADADPGAELKFRFIFLYTTFEELMSRVAGRQGHYMKADMVRSQYDIMEVPVGDEIEENGGECISVDTTGKTPAEIMGVIGVHKGA